MPEREFQMRLRNHPGALLHVVALLVRRGFRATALAAAVGADRRWLEVALRVEDDGRMTRLLRELERLYDVEEVREAVDPAPSSARDALCAGSVGAGTAVVAG